jgi:simple sugar transport system ATP-binding protein
VQASAATASDAPSLEARGISKHFGAVTALDRAQSQVGSGRGLGRSRRQRRWQVDAHEVLSGLFRPSEGEILVEGRPMRFHSPRDSHRAGIEMVYQDLALAGNMPIFENIYLGREPGRTFGGLTIVDHARSRRLAAEHLERLQIHVKSVDQNVEDLSGGQRQAVAIARATAFDAKVVIMDEPTAALAIKEVGKVLDLIRRLKDHGVGVILISHFASLSRSCSTVCARSSSQHFIHLRATSCRSIAA